MLSIGLEISIGWIVDSGIEFWTSLFVLELYQAVLLISDWIICKGVSLVCLFVFLLGDLI